MLPFVSPAGPIYRIARAPNPWSLPDWSRAHDDKTFGNRFDDSAGYFRVIYAGSDPLTCFMETLARFRKAPSHLQQDLDAILGPSDYMPLGRVPASWLQNRKIGRASLSGKRFADIYSSEWLSCLRREFEMELIDQDVSGSATQQDFDLSIVMSQNRQLTQKIATFVYGLQYDGIFYHSRYGQDLRNWAMFEPFALNDYQASDLTHDDPDFQQALRRLDLAFEQEY